MNAMLDANLGNFENCTAKCGGVTKWVRNAICLFLQTESDFEFVRFLISISGSESVRIRPVAGDGNGLR